MLPVRNQSLHLNNGLRELFARVMYFVIMAIEKQSGNTIFNGIRFVLYIRTDGIAARERILGVVLHRYQDKAFHFKALRYDERTEGLFNRTGL